MFSGSPKTAGAAYGLCYYREAAGFFSQEYAQHRVSSAYAKACWRAMQRYTPRAAEFTRGMASESLLTKEQHVWMLLHEEELYHRKFLQRLPHCSAAAIAGNSRVGAVIGQNWDWSTAYYPWLSFNRFNLAKSPRVLALSFPGLPICAGINSAGLSLMWTGAGYYPPLRPVSGVPTYALTFELLLKRSVPEALEWLKKVPNAGAFIFFLADRQGKVALIEGTPGKVFSWSGAHAHRANVYELPEACRASRQRLPPEGKCNSRIRNRIFERKFSHPEIGKPLLAVQQILDTPGIKVGPKAAHATLVQLAASTKTGAMHIKLWRESRWKKFYV